MTLKQEAFIQNYVNPESDTYSNGTQSYLQAYKIDNEATARVNASKLLTKANIQSSMTELIEQMNMGDKVRLDTIREVLTGNHEQQTITTTTDKDGNKYTAKTLKTPTASDRLKAVDLLAKIDGTYDKNKVKADIVSSELKELIKAQRKALE